MQESEFIKICDEALAILAEKIENADIKAQLDIEYADGILNILIEETGQKYVINRHSASQKIWYSSPFSGADYFSFTAASGKWLDSKEYELEDKIFLELEKHIFSR
jgi:iron donor protein CyaY